MALTCIFLKSSVSFFVIARELLSNWAKSKLQLELTSDGEAEVDSVPENPTALLKYKRFDGESTAKQLLARL